MQDKQIILIIDDIPLNIQMLNEALKDEYTIYFATNGTDALTIAENNKPDIVLMDIMMPGIDGYELCRQFKGNILFKDIPVIFITALDEIENESTGLKLGAVDYITKPFNPEIVRLRVRNQLELKRSRDILSNLSRIDGLTGIPNRRAFEEVIQREWLRAVREGKFISVLMIDVDYFKLYNDYFGHVAGDECLKIVAKTIKEALLRPGDFVARYGGEEFVCLLPDTDSDGALHTANNISKAIINLNIPHPTSLVFECVTVSIGISSMAAQKNIDFSLILLNADKALYKAKENGRNTFVLHSTDINGNEKNIQENVTEIFTNRKDLIDLLIAFPQENPNPILCVSSKGILLYCNKSSRAIFQDWCLNEGSLVPDFFIKAIKESENSKQVEINYQCRQYSFTTVYFEVRDAIFLYGMDVTNIKEAENERLRLKKIIDESINIVFITDFEGNIEYVNSTFERVTGYKKDLVIGKNPRILASGETSKENYKNLWDTIKSGKTWRGIFKNKKLNGEIYWVNGFVSPIRNEFGHITHFMAIQEDISEKMLAEAKLHYLSSYDPVTSILNRSRFVELLSEFVSSDKDSARIGILLLVNVDGFKLINDTYGHSVGDQFLKAFASFLKEQVFEYDSANSSIQDSIVGRVGGDEFAIFLFDRDERYGVRIAEELRRKIENYRFMNDMIRATATIGISLYPEQGNTVADLLSKANAAVMRAKDLGQNRCYIYNDEDKYLRTASSSLEEKQMIISAMEEDRFIPYFQPILDLHTGTIHHYESLARLISPDGKVMLPSSFIFTAERYGLVTGIDKIITFKTMSIQSELSRIGRKISFSMNLSGKHLGDSSMLEYLKNSLQNTGADPQFIVFEITETAAIQDFARAVDFVRELKSMGCKFSLDDFGVGFTSFVHLIEMSVDFIKIDGSFVRNLPNREKDRILVKAISEMARGLGIKTIAEYVDKVETLNILKELAVDYAQGYYIGKPSPSLL